jgi:hypothetical protein
MAGPLPSVFCSCLFTVDCFKQDEIRLEFSSQQQSALPFVCVGSLPDFRNLKCTFYRCIPYNFTSRHDVYVDLLLTENVGSTAHKGRSTRYEIVLYISDREGTQLSMTGYSAPERTDLRRERKGDRRKIT